MSIATNATAHLGHLKAPRSPGRGCRRVRAMSAFHKANQGTPLFDLGYTFYDNGLIKTRVDTVTGRNEQFSYDSLQRLTNWTLQHGPSTRSSDYGYDTIGNLMTVKVNNVVTESNSYGTLLWRPHVASPEWDDFRVPSSPLDRLP